MGGLTLLSTKPSSPNDSVKFPSDILAPWGFTFVIDFCGTGISPLSSVYTSAFTIAATQWGLHWGDLRS